MHIVALFDAVHTLHCLSTLLQQRETTRTDCVAVSQVVIEAGDENQKKWAKGILPIREVCIPSLV